MRRLGACALFGILLSCSTQDEALRAAGTATMLNAGDPRADRQFTKGVYPVEGTVRWTARTFTVVLKPPPSAARKGAILFLRYGVPDSNIRALGTIAMNAAVNGLGVQPELIRKAGEFDYSREVPAGAFRGGDATVEFSLDKAMGPHDNERRELGIVVITVGFEAK